METNSKMITGIHIKNLTGITAALEVTDQNGVSLTEQGKVWWPIKIELDGLGTKVFLEYGEEFSRETLTADLLSMKYDDPSLTLPFEIHPHGNE